MHAASSRSDSEAVTRNGGATFVLVHGAWSGAWNWSRVAERLLARGHRVVTPTLSGLGERSHLGRLPIDLTTHVLDVENEMKWKDLEQVVLVGHSYAGFVITSVAERALSRLASIVYVDGFVPADGESFADLLPYWDFTKPLISPPPSSEGDYVDEADRKWADGKATPQPSRTFTEKVRVAGAYQKVPKKAYVLATGWQGFQATAAKLRPDPSWTVYEVQTGHDIPIEAPDELTRILESCA